MLHTRLFTPLQSAALLIKSIWVSNSGRYSFPLACWRSFGNSFLISTSVCERISRIIATLELWEPLCYYASLFRAVDSETW
ncbi:hypothetical protein CEXT_67221 [Caerostris extrusa]|uniref:Uncharacterized protein n=1 Tax=Caerostris extrusa TaxID=172846 RepID=A0AAV4R5T6_CAEEX|nr:hypothetical protein CEXT_67221 [Caerostris extrusa]